MQTPDSPNTHSTPSWETTMRSASDRLTVEPADESWSALSSRLSKPAPEKRTSFLVLSGRILVRIAAVLVLGVGIWWVTSQPEKAEPLTSEWITDSPVYFASYLDMAQQLEGYTSGIEGTGHADFRKNFSGAPVTGDTMGNL